MRRLGEGAANGCNARLAHSNIGFVLVKHLRLDLQRNGFSAMKFPQESIRKESAVSL